jgi:hypothetical protein
MPCSLLLQFTRQFQRFFDVLSLGGLVATCQQNHYFKPYLRDVNAVSWSEVNAHLRHTPANWLAVAEIAFLSAVNACLNPGSSSPVLEAGKPNIEFFSYRIVRMYPTLYG